MPAKLSLFRYRSLQHWILTPALLLALTTPCKLIAQTVTADSAPDNAPAKSRPRIGLVLSGGGARGYAHIGVLQYLEKMHIPVDYITGTSIGALIGGLYASGIAPDVLQHGMDTINLNDLVFDRNDRTKLPQFQREDDYQYPISINAGFGDKKLKLAPGLIQGNNLLALLQNLTQQLPSDISFDKLPIPFHAIATDLGQGSEVILRDGSLPEAMRASMAVPGLFAPFQIKGRTLVDGGLVSNLPIRQARDMGADIIIAVNIATPLQDPTKFQSPSAVAQQMLTILIQQNVKAQEALLGKQDVLIEPDLPDLALTDTNQADNTIKAGLDAAQRLSQRLAPLSLPEDQWKAYLAQRQAAIKPIQEVRIDAIDIHTSGNIPPEYVRSRMNVKEGDVYDSSELNQQLSQLSTHGDFSTLRQEIITENGKTVLRIDAEDKSWGPQYLLFGAGFSSYLNGKGSYNIQLGHRYPWMNSSGLEWRNDLTIGDTYDDLHTELRQPIFGYGGMYIAPYVDVNRRYVDVYTSNSLHDTPATQYRIDKTTTGVDLGIPIARLGEIRTGLNYQNTNYSAVYNFNRGRNQMLYSSYRTDQPVAHLQATVDQLDDPVFAHKGYYLYGELERGFGVSDYRYSTSQFKGLWASSSGRNTINLAFEVDADLSSNNKGFGYSLGGFQRLSAYSTDKFTGNYLLYGRVTYLHDLENDNLFGLRKPVVGSSFELGNVWLTRKTFGNGPYRKSLSLFVGGNSPIGTLYFGGALGVRGNWNLYVQLGRVF
jgi:NTE family protein